MRRQVINFLPRTFDEGVVVRQVFLHEEGVWLDELLKQHHVRGVSAWRCNEEGDGFKLQRTSSSMYLQIPKISCKLGF